VLTIDEKMHHRQNSIMKHGVKHTTGGKSLPGYQSGVNTFEDSLCENTEVLDENDSTSTS
jgi:hypothetical protein